VSGDISRSGEGRQGRRRWGPQDHPAPETLSAYYAGELLPEAADAVQEHIANCGICTEVILDLQRFLEAPPEDPPASGIADFETAAEWRELRGQLDLETGSQAPVVSRGVFASARGAYSIAAASLAVAVALGLWNLSLIEKSREPIAVRTIRTLSAQSDLRGPAEQAGAERPVILPAEIALRVSDDPPAPSYRVDVLPVGSRFPERSLEISVQESELVLLLPDKSLRPGKYLIQVQGLRNGQPTSRVSTYDLRIGPSGR
jgi:hypothetical protein